MEIADTTLTIFDFDDPSQTWREIDDRVMGGRSTSTMKVAGGRALFAGEVSLANGGGFASLRSKPIRVDLRPFDGVRVRARGDGKSYSLRLRTSSDYDEINYRAPIAFRESGQWTEISLAFQSFVPVFRGRVVPYYPPLEPGAIEAFGLMIGERQEGRFRLEIDRIEAYRVERKDIASSDSSAA